MPSGITHDRITLWTLPWIAGLGYALTRDGELTLILSGGFLFSGMMFGPDLDINSVQYKRWGFLKRIWIPYRHLFRHRSLFSHGPIFGTCIRIIYLSFFIALVSILAVGVAQLFLGFAWNWHQFVLKYFSLLSNKYLKETIALLLGLELGAMSHSISDLIGSSRKRYLRKKNSKRVKIAKINKTTKIQQKADS